MTGVSVGVSVGVQGCNYHNFNWPSPVPSPYHVLGHHHSLLYEKDRLGVILVSQLFRLQEVKYQTEIWTKMEICNSKNAGVKTFQM